MVLVSISSLFYSHNRELQISLFESVDQDLIKIKIVFRKIIFLSDSLLLNIYFERYIN